MNRKWSYIFERVETYTLVTVITVLVWLYAEGENVRNYPNERVMVRFTPPPGERNLGIKPRNAVQVLVNFRASAGEMGLLKETLSKGPIPIEVSNDDHGGAQEQTVVLKEELEQSSLGGLGLNILSTKPATEKVEVVPLIHVKLPVTVSKPAMAFVEPPTPDPREVSVQLPEYLGRQAEDASIAAQLGRLDLSSYDVNTKQTVGSVPLKAPLSLQSPWTKLGQPTAKVSFEIRKLTDTWVAPKINVTISADPLTLKEYEIDVRQKDIFLHDVKLTGPSEAIDKLRRGEAKVWAELRPTRQQVENKVTTLTPVIVAPDGVTASSPPPPIPVTIGRK